MAIITCIPCDLRSSSKHTCFHFELRPGTFKQPRLRVDILRKSKCSTYFFIGNVGVNFTFCEEIPLFASFLMHLGMSFNLEMAFGYHSFSCLNKVCPIQVHHFGQSLYSGYNFVVWYSRIISFKYLFLGLNLTKILLPPSSRSVG